MMNCKTHMIYSFIMIKPSLPMTIPIPYILQQRSRLLVMSHGPAAAAAAAQVLPHGLMQEEEVVLY